MAQQNQNVQFTFLAVDNVSQAAQRIAQSLSGLNLAAQGPAKVGLQQLADQFRNLNAVMKLTDPEHRKLMQNIGQIPGATRAIQAGLLGWDAATKTITVDFSKLAVVSASAATAINRALDSSLNPINRNVMALRSLLNEMDKLAQGGRNITQNRITGLQGRLGPIIASGGAANIFGVNTGAGTTQEAIAARTAQNFQNQQALQAERFANQQALIAQRAAAQASDRGRGLGASGGFSRLTPFGRSAYRAFTGIGVGIQAAQIGVGIGGGGGGGFNPIQLLFLMNAFERLPAIAVPAAAALIGVTAAISGLAKATLEAGGLEKYRLQLEAILRLHGQIGATATSTAQAISDQATNLAKSTGLPLGDVRTGVATLTRGRLTGQLYQKAAATLALEQGNTFAEASKDLSDLVTSGGAKMEEFAAKYELTTQRIFGRARPTVAAFGDSVTLANKILAGMGAEAEKIANTVPNILERINTSFKSLFETLGTPLQGFAGAGLGALLDGINRFEAGLKSALNDPAFQAFLKQGIGEFLSALKDAQPVFENFGSALINLIVDGIKSFITYAPIWVGIFKGLAVVLTPLIQVFDFLAKLSILFAQGLKAVGDMLKPVLSFLKPLFDLLGAFATFLKEFILDAATRFVAWLKEVASHAQETWDAFLSSPLGQWLQDRMHDIENLAHTIATFWNEHGQQFWDFLQGLGNFAGKIIEIGWHWMEEWMSILWDFITGAVSYAAKIVKIALDFGGGILYEAWQWLMVDGDQAHLTRIVDLIFLAGASVAQAWWDWIQFEGRILHRIVDLEFTWLSTLGDFITGKKNLLKILVELVPSGPLADWINGNGVLPRAIKTATEPAPEIQGGIPGLNKEGNDAVNQLVDYIHQMQIEATKNLQPVIGDINRNNTGLNAAPTEPVNEPGAATMQPVAYRPGNTGLGTMIINIINGSFTDRESIRQTAKDVGDQINANLRLSGAIQVA